MHNIALGDIGVRCGKWEKDCKHIYIVSAMRSWQTGGSWHVRGLQVVDSATGFGAWTTPIGRRTHRPQVVVDVVVGLHQDSLLLATSVYASWIAREKGREKKRKYIKMGVIVSVYKVEQINETRMKRPVYTQRMYSSLVFPGSQTKNMTNTNWIKQTDFIQILSFPGIGLLSFLQFVL